MCRVLLLTIPILTQLFAVVSLAGAQNPPPIITQSAITRPPAHVDFAVICEDPEVREKLNSLLRAEIMKNSDLVWDARLPARKLFIYAQKDINDRKNPNGWSFAVAQVSNLPNQILAARMMKCDAPQCEEVRKFTYEIVKEEGMLKHMNVAHLDEMSDAALSELIGTLFSTFVAKAKGQ